MVSICVHLALFLFFFNDTATTEIYTLSLHDALPISVWIPPGVYRAERAVFTVARLAAYRPHRAGQARSHTRRPRRARDRARSEEHTSELQSQSNLVCRLLLEKKIKRHATTTAGTIST